MAVPDYAPALFRRIQVASERSDNLYAALHLALIVVFMGIMIALWTIRQDLLQAIERK